MSVTSKVYRVRWRWLKRANVKAGDVCNACKGGGTVKFKIKFPCEACEGTGKQSVALAKMLSK